MLCLDSTVQGLASTMRRRSTGIKPFGTQWQWGYVRILWCPDLVVRGDSFYISFLLLVRLNLQVMSHSIFMPSASSDDEQQLRTTQSSTLSSKFSCMCTKTEETKKPAVAGKGHLAWQLQQFNNHQPSQFFICQLLGQKGLGLWLLRIS